MPHHPTEENAPSGLTDKIAQESSDAQTSNHPMHDENKGPINHGASSELATAEAHKSRGPQISDKLPSVEGTKEQLKAKASELNQK